MYIKYIEFCKTLRDPREEKETEFFRGERGERRRVVLKNKITTQSQKAHRIQCP